MNAFNSEQEVNIQSDSSQNYEKTNKPVVVVVLGLVIIVQLTQEKDEQLEEPNNSGNRQEQLKRAEFIVSDRPSPADKNEQTGKGEGRQYPNHMRELLNVGKSHSIVTK